jgi:hypothetical protein
MVVLAIGLGVALVAVMVHRARRCTTDDSREQLLEPLPERWTRAAVLSRRG